LLSLLDPEPFEVGARRRNSEMSKCVLSFQETQILFIKSNIIVSLCAGPRLIEIAHQLEEEEEEHTDPAFTVQWTSK